MNTANARHEKQDEASGIRSRGKFIVFEGIDGAGKSTQIKLLAKTLSDEGQRVYVTAEPTSSITGGMLRDALSGITERSACELASLFLLDRIFHNINPVNGIKMMLEQGIHVICDRYYYSTLAYQGSDTDFEWVKNMNLHCPEIMPPDLCVFLDLTPEESLKRIASSRVTLDIYEKKETLERFRSSFYKVFRLEEEKDRVKIVNAGRDVRSIAGEIYSIVKQLL